MQKFKSILVLILTFFSFALLVIFMPFQVYDVFQSSDSNIVDAEVVYSDFGKIRGKNGCWMEIEFRILSNNENIVIKDAKPGDIATCNSKENFKFFYKPGDLAVIYLTKNGKYYLSLGSYIEAFTPAFFSLIWLVFLFIRIKIYNKQSKIEEKKQNRTGA